VDATGGPIPQTDHIAGLDNHNKGWSEIMIAHQMALERHYVAESLPTITLSDVTPQPSAVDNHDEQQNEAIDQ
jgi:hypothetical protein